MSIVLHTDIASSADTRAGAARALLPGVAVLLVAVALARASGWRQAALLLVGVAAGVVLYRAAFGFTGAWRDVLQHRRGEGLRAQLLLFGVTAIAFFPLIDAGAGLGTALRGSLAPVGLPVVVGAFLFGVGMQLAGGCASGTLYTAGGGNTRMLATLTTFVAGAFIASLHARWWASIPSLPPISLGGTLGMPIGLVVTLGLLALVAWVSLVAERRARAAAVVARAPLGGPAWPLLAGVAGLAMVNVATLLLAGRPWSVAGAFPLWGAKLLAAGGAPVSSWPAWSGPAQQAALRAPVWADVTTVMNVGIVLGAWSAAVLAGRFAPAWKTSARSLAVAAAGGLLLGYGARVGYGCNIGALFGGIASGSVHGWVWFAAAFAGSAVGVRLRPACGLTAPGEPDAATAPLA